mmetsp:Transcript_89655/g.109747  ORF Transcript_89655/g.109747 Transcript_89655/m.109747 type:complete len:216 (+) Transcript_89655:137-784(+)
MNIDKKWKLNKNSKEYLQKGKQKKDVFICDVISFKGCQELIRLTEERGYEDAGYPKSYRSNTRLITDDAKLAELLYRNIKPFMNKMYEMYDPITEETSNWEMIGLNSRFRWCKYIKNQKFDMHYDSWYKKNKNIQSLYTVNIYLNDSNEYPGKKYLGRTRFYNKQNDNKASFYAKGYPGRALIFNHFPNKYLHDGEMVESGQKYLMRTDIIYKKI